MPKKSSRVVGFRGSAKRAIRKYGVMSPRALREIEQRYQISEMRRDGFTVREIAIALDISMATVRSSLQKALELAINTTAETTEESRQLQIERLDLLLKTYKPFATEWHKEERIDALSGQAVIIECPPDPKYANLILTIEMRRAKLLALDVPETKRLDVSGVREYVGVKVEDV